MPVEGSAGAVRRATARDARDVEADSQEMASLTGRSERDDKKGKGGGPRKIEILAAVSVLFGLVVFNYVMLPLFKPAGDGHHNSHHSHNVHWLVGAYDKCPGIGEEQVGHAPAPAVSLDNATEASAAQRLDTLKPLMWIHFPKCGASFLNTLTHHPGICPYFPALEVMSEGDKMHHYLRDNNVHHLCPGSFSPVYKSPPGHHGAGPAFASEAGRALAFFRQPEQRIISGYHHDLHSYPPSMMAGKPKPTPPEYAKVVSGCMTRMLTHRGTNPCGDTHHPKPEQVKLAVDRVKNDFAFVGITEEWELSVCLFHIMFGGMCCPFEMENMRPGTNRPDGNSRTKYDTTILEGFVDVYDREVYAAARERFDAELVKYGVTHERCQALCGTR
mmetsp:Transcript_7369/g.16134  ORF Transcript_7369/g.16134 Transcript_7369/m.16134 type:complete len:387 (-) Transcript_7369:174-1334(-)